MKIRTWVIGVLLLHTYVQADEVIDTNLGEAGNRWVAETFQKYLATAQGCVPKTTHRRVMLQGFGPFSGIEKNLSGAVAALLAGQSDLPVTQNGGWSATRTMVVDGEKIEFCFLYLDVVWDLAGAILLTEIERFNPELVLMSGVGTDIAIAEGGASNSALGLAGYDALGNYLKDKNTPWCETGPCGYADKTHVLSPALTGVEPTVNLSWDNVMFAKYLRTKLTEFAPQIAVESPKEAREGNNYLCNNVSYIVQSAANGTEIKLAGDRIHFAPKPSRRAVGFLHYPAVNSPVEEWIVSWAGAVSYALKNTLR